MKTLWAILGLLAFVIVTSVLANVILQRALPTRQSDSFGRHALYRVLFIPVWLVVALVAGALIAIVSGERLW